MKKVWDPPVSKLTIPLTRFRTNQQNIMDHSETDDCLELNLPTLTSSPRDGIYRIETSEKLSTPYQSLLTTTSDFFIYTWTLPNVSTLEFLAGIGSGCFTDTSHTIGLLFPQPIAQPDYVCRVPIYLSRGLARARVQKINHVRLDQTQLKLILSVHSVLAELLTELMHRELYSVDADACNKSRMFDQLEWNPKQSLFVGLMAIITNKMVDWKASEQLMLWSEALTQYRCGIRGHTTLIGYTPDGILTAYPCALSSLPQNMLHGRLVRPHSLPKADLGLFVVCDETNKSNPTAKSNGSIVSCYRLSRHLNACRVSSGLSEKTSNPKPVSYRITDCFVHPLSAWLWFSLSLVPTILYQMNRALLSVEFCARLLQLVLPNMMSSDLRTLYQLTILVPDRLDAPKGMLRQLYYSTTNDTQAEVDNASRNLDKKATTCLPNSSLIPGPVQLLEATTLLGAADAVNLERLEFIGDSLLQLITTLQVYQNLPSVTDEKQLTIKRSALVSNANLFGIATRQHWYRYCTSRPFDIQDLFIPPCYIVASQYQKPNNPQLFVKLTNKSIADLVEAVLGCFLQHVGLREACGLLHRMGITFMDNMNDTSTSMWNSFFHDPLSLAEQLGKLTFKSGPQDCVDQSATDPEVVKLQERLGYQFRNRTLIDTARTHNSLPSANPQDCYQRLEFLGDAVLGYIVSKDLFEEFPDYDPGQLTTHRSLIVNNLVLARVLVDQGLYTGIRHSVPSLNSMIENLRSIRMDEVTSLKELEQAIRQQITASPIKMLGDVLESLIGAVFVDTAGDLKTTETVVHRLLGRVMKIPP